MPPLDPSTRAPRRKPPPATVGVLVNGLPDLESYDIFEASSSGGKDSQAMKSYLARLLRERGLLARGVAVHADLGRVEWPETPDLVRRQAEHLGLAYRVVKREQGDLLEHVEAMGHWMKPGSRYCTSDHKRAQIWRMLTQLANELRVRRAEAFYKHETASCLEPPRRPVRILNCIGLRAEESPAREHHAELLLRDPRPTGWGHVKVVDVWLPIQGWSTARVWEECYASGAPIHPAYAAGFPRASCRFCIYAPEAALRRAGQLFPDLLDEYVRIEEKIEEDFKHHLPLAKVRADLRAGLGPEGPIQSWCM